MGSKIEIKDLFSLSLLFFSFLFFLFLFLSPFFTLLFFRVAFGPKASEILSQVLPF